MRVTLNSGFFIGLTISLVLGACKAKISSDLPVYTDYATPSPAPRSPGDDFEPLMVGAPHNGTPMCAEWTQTAGPDESLIVTGDNFTHSSQISAQADTRFKVYSANGSVTDANILRADKEQAVITIDKSVPKWSMYLIWPGNKAGYGAPIAVNKTDAWWMGPLKATRRSRVSVYGRNLSKHNDTVASHVYIKSVIGAGLWARVLKVNPYKVDFEVPAYLPNGSYEVWMHNGHGAKYGWSGPLTLTITSAHQWSKTVYNVREFGAKGDGVTDDTEAIHRALEAARKVKNSSVFFPSGTYMITKMLTISDNTRWMGEGRNKSIIRCHSKFFTSDAMIFGRSRTIQINDLAFDTNGNYRGGGGDFRAQAINLSGSSDVKLLNVEFACIGYGALRLDNASEVLMENSKIVSRMSFLGSCSNLLINKCDFYLTNDAEMALHSWNGRNISMTNSTCRDYDNSNPNDGSGWGKGRFFHSAGNGGSTRHTYLENNRTYDLGVRPIGADQNSGEQFLWEGFAANWAGRVKSSSGTHTTLLGFKTGSHATKAIAVITKGRGKGQSRWVSGVKGSTIELEKPWNVQPNKSSRISLGSFADRIVLYNNFMDGKASAVYSENFTASSGIQPYGGVLNFIADRNTLTEVRSGIANWATQHRTGIDPNYFNLYINNVISRCRWGIVNALLELKRPETGLMGSTFRNNIVNNAVESGIAIWLSPASIPVMENFLYEHNTFWETPKTFLIRNRSNSVSQQTFYKNKFSSKAIDESPGMKMLDNNFSTFSFSYSELPTIKHAETK
jgi:hypothetical protein